MSLYLDSNQVAGLGRHRVHHGGALLGLGRRKIHRHRRVGGALLGLGRRSRRYGRGFFGDVWNGLKSGVSKIIPSVHNLIKNTGAISKGLSFVPGIGGLASGAAKALGYGRRRRVYRKRRGGALSERARLLLGLGRRRIVRRRRVGGMSHIHRLVHAHVMRALEMRRPIHRRRVGGVRKRVHRRRY